MTSSTLAIPASYHKPTPVVRKSKLDPTQVRSEDELLKFFLHGSYDVQRGNKRTTPTEENTDKTVCIKDEQAINSSLNTDKSRCMFEETYMINISVKQPNAKPSSKQIDVRIEKTPADTKSSSENVVDDDDDDDDISSIFDEEEEQEEEEVGFNEINSSTPSTKLTLADMINKTLTTIPTSSTDKLNQVNNNWYVDKQSEIKTQIPPPATMVEKVIKKTSSPAPVSQATLTTNIQEDEKLFEYLDYLETKEETIKPSNIPTSVIKIFFYLDQIF
jgi:hypothetical protein